MATTKKTNRDYLLTMLKTLEGKRAAAAGLWTLRYFKSSGQVARGSYARERRRMAGEEHAALEWRPDTREIPRPEGSGIKA